MLLELLKKMMCFLRWDASAAYRQVVWCCWSYYRKWCITKGEVLLLPMSSSASLQELPERMMDWAIRENDGLLELPERKMDCLSCQREWRSAWAIRERKMDCLSSQRKWWIIWAIRENDELLELSERMIDCLSCQREWWIAWGVRENDGSALAVRENDIIAMMSSDLW